MALPALWYAVPGVLDFVVSPSLVEERFRVNERQEHSSEETDGPHREETEAVVAFDFLMMPL